MVATIMNRGARLGQFSAQTVAEFEGLMRDVQCLSNFSLVRAHRLILDAGALVNSGERSFRAYQTAGQLWHQKEMLHELKRRSKELIRDLTLISAHLWSEVDELAVANCWKEELSELPQRCERTVQAIRMRIAEYDGLLAKTSQMYDLVDAVTAADAS